LFKEDKVCTEFLENEERLWKDTQVLSTFIGHASEFEAIIFVGGHGRASLFLPISSLFYWRSRGIAMFDLAKDPNAKALIAEFAEAGKVVSAVCHGSAALLDVKLSDGSLLVKDQPVTGFSNAEEDQLQSSSVMPFMLETELVNDGGKYEKAEEAWGEKICIGRGGKLITGQNPASGSALGEAIKKAIVL
jgi:putative intracellular protease/amidase